VGMLGGAACKVFLSPMNTPRKMEDVRVEGTEKPSRRSVNSGRRSVGLSGIRYSSLTPCGGIARFPYG
jgi:hypothetical protein